MRLLPIASTATTNVLPLAAPRLLVAVPLVGPTPLLLLLSLVVLLIPAMGLFVPALLPPTTPPAAAAAATCCKVAIAAGIPIRGPLPAAAPAVVLLLLAAVVLPFPATVSLSSSIRLEAPLPRLAIAIPAWTVVLAGPAVSAVTHPMLLLLLLLARRARPPSVIMVRFVVICVQVLQDHAALGERLLLLLPLVTAAVRTDVWFIPGGVTAL